jgi:iron(III) transport system permease protein
MPELFLTVFSPIGNTLGLFLLTVLFCCGPVVFLFRCWYHCSNRGRFLLEGLIAFLAILPLTITASGWQAILGPRGLLTQHFLVDTDWRPWQTGLFFAAGVHTIALLPWLCFLCIYVWESTDRAIREECRLLIPGLRWKLTRTLFQPAWLIGLLLILQLTVTEIVVVDFAMVPTLAEEIYTRSVLGYDTRTEWLHALPVVLLSGWLWCQYSDRLCTSWNDTRAVETSGSRRAFWLAAVPLAMLIAGPVLEWIRQLGPTPVAQFQLVAKVYARTLLVSLCGSFFLAVWITSAAALLFLLPGENRSSMLLRCVLLFLFCVPAPVSGITLKSIIAYICDLESHVSEQGICRRFLYDGPSPLPEWIARFCRFLPVAFLLLEPSIRPGLSALRSEMRSLGMPACKRFRAVIWPACRSRCTAVVACITFLAMGEVSASKYVQTPGTDSFSQDLFNQMHYGVPGTVAGMCLLQFGMTAAVYTVVFWCVRGAGKNKFT